MPVTLGYWDIRGVSDKWAAEWEGHKEGLQTWFQEEDSHQVFLEPPTCLCQNSPQSKLSPCLSPSPPPLFLSLY